MICRNGDLVKLGPGEPGIIEELPSGRLYKDGSILEDSKSRAVVEIGGLRFGGFLAWMAWLALHISVLVGFRNRVAVLFSWIYGYVFMRRGSRPIRRCCPPWCHPNSWPAWPN